MNSNSIYPLNHIPYFYIIEHIPSGMKYAGSRWAKCCNPSELLQPNGYKTSSARVHRLIAADGLDSFRILEIVTADCVCIPFGFSHILYYESWFLQTNDCATSSEWINGHNNTNTREEVCMKAFGEMNPMKDPVIVQKSKENSIKGTLNKHGVSYILQVPEIKKKQQETCNITVMNKYGVRNVFQLQEVKEKSKETNISKYGVDNNSKTDERRLYRKNTNNEIVICEYCEAQIPRAAYYSSHGKYCTHNPDKETVQRKICIINIYTAERKTVPIDYDIPDGWYMQTSKAWLIYSNTGELATILMRRKIKVQSRVFMLGKNVKSPALHKPRHKNRNTAESHLGEVFRTHKMVSVRIGKIVELIRDGVFSGSLVIE